MPHLSPSNHRGRSPSSNGCNNGDLSLIYNVKRTQEGGRSLPRPAGKTYQRSSGTATPSGWQQGGRSRSSETNGGRQLIMSRSATHNYAASTASSRSHQLQLQQQQQQQQHPRQQQHSRSLSRSHEERALRSTSSRQSLTSSKNSLNQSSQPAPYNTNPVIQSSLTNSITSSSGSKNALAASITQQVKKFFYVIKITEKNEKLNLFDTKTTAVVI